MERTFSVVWDAALDVFLIKEAIAAVAAAALETASDEQASTMEEEPAQPPPPTSGDGADLSEYEHTQAEKWQQMLPSLLSLGFMITKWT